MSGSQATSGDASYADFSLDVFRKAAGKRIPLQASIEVTHRCPLTCSHCYNNLPVADPEARKTELTLEEHRRLLDELHDAGCLWILYTGGEIFARKDFLDIYTYARERGFLITLFTNGILIDEAIADHLAKYRPFAIEITLYGRTRETYEALTGIRGSYDRCLRGVRLLRDRNLPLKLKTVAVSVNHHEIEAMREFAETELGVPFKFDGMINPRIDCSSSPLAVRLAAEELVSLDMVDPKRRDLWRAYADQYAGDAPERVLPRNGEIYHCGGGVQSFAIDPSGKMSICVLSHAEHYDIRSGSFREGWNGFLRNVRAKKATRPTKCVECGLKSLCGMCPANGELESQDPEEPVDFLCRVGHLRAHAFGLEIPAHGDCVYCEGGASHEAVRDSGKLLRQGKFASALASPPPAAVVHSARLTVLKSSSEASCSPSGCSSCGS